MSWLYTFLKDLIDRLIKAPLVQQAAKSIPGGIALLLIALGLPGVVGAYIFPELRWVLVPGFGLVVVGVFVFGIAVLVVRPKVLEKDTEHRLTLLDKLCLTLPSNIPSYDELINAFKDITFQATSILEVDRVSVWEYDEQASRLRCLVIYDTTNGHYWEEHEVARLELTGIEARAYVNLLRGARYVAITDVYTDIRTRILVNHLRERKIRSLLDAPIRTGNQLWGALCHGSKSRRTWRGKEKEFATILATLASMVTTQWDSENKKKQRAKHPRKEPNNPPSPPCCTA